MNPQLLTIKNASRWASDFTGRAVTAANISYLVQYGRIRKIRSNGVVHIDRAELSSYYQRYRDGRAGAWRRLGADINRALSFEQYTEAETTKHVHRLHPYKGKFIPQLAEYFLDGHTDAFKKSAPFRAGDIVLDPFCGSGTTMVQACELGMHCIGVDISSFNAFISNAKVAVYDIADAERELRRITDILRAFARAQPARAFDVAVHEKLSAFNQRHFPAPEYKYRLRRKEIDEKTYGAQKERAFLKEYNRLMQAHGIRLTPARAETFSDKWFCAPVRAEIDLLLGEIKKIKNAKTKQIAGIILSRAARSCRATTHADLATLRQPVHAAYYCAKHGKICRPLISVFKWWDTYAKDTVKRLRQFDELRTRTAQHCITADSRSADIAAKAGAANDDLRRLLKRKKIKGVFSSPPYVGLIDYHEQHAYAYDIFGWRRRDEKEIGALRAGQGKTAREAYAADVSAVLKNCAKYMTPDYDVFLVANDKYNLYPLIADKAGMKIVARYNRPVLNRTEKDKRAYAETIFHLKRGRARQMIIL